MQNYPPAGDSLSRVHDPACINANQHSSSTRKQKRNPIVSTFSLLSIFRQRVPSPSSSSRSCARARLAIKIPALKRAAGIIIGTYYRSYLAIEITESSTRQNGPICRSSGSCSYTELRRAPYGERKGKRKDRGGSERERERRRDRPVDYPRARPIFIVQLFFSSWPSRGRCHREQPPPWGCFPFLSSPLPALPRQCKEISGDSHDRLAILPRELTEPRQSPFINGAGRTADTFRDLADGGREWLRGREEETYPRWSYRGDAAERKICPRRQRHKSVHFRAILS